MVFFRRFDTRLFLWKCQKRHFWNITSPKVGEHRIQSNFLNFGLIGCISTKNCAKSKILNIKVRIRKSKYHQKIPCIRFAETDISNYGLIFNTNSARDQNEIFIEKPYFFLESAFMCIDEKWSTVMSLAVSSLQNVKIHPHHPLKRRSKKLNFQFECSNSRLSTF
jgi:hypothetical protein